MINELIIQNLTNQDLIYLLNNTLKDPQKLAIFEELFKENPDNRVLLRNVNKLIDICSGDF